MSNKTAAPIVSVEVRDNPNAFWPLDNEKEAIVVDGYGNTHRGVGSTESSAISNAVRKANR